MNRIYIIIILLIIISCNKNNDSTKKSPIDTVILSSNNRNTINEIINTSVDDKLIETPELRGIWEFEKAVLADNKDIPDNEKILMVKDQIIEIYNDQLIVRNLCKSKIIIRKKSSLDYWGSEKTLTYQRTAFKNAGLNLSDSILVIENSTIDGGCELPFQSYYS